MKVSFERDEDHTWVVVIALVTPIRRTWIGTPRSMICVNVAPLNNRWRCCTASLFFIIIVGITATFSKFSQDLEGC